MTREDMKFKLEDYLIPRRYIHSLNVMNVSIDLANRFGEDVEKAAIAGLLHDCARDMSRERYFEICDDFGIEVTRLHNLQPQLLHGPIGAEIAKIDYGIEDEDIINAIRYHTTGRDNMSLLEKIVYVADFIEPDRSFPKIEEARRAAFKDINEAMIMSLNRTIKHVVAKGVVIHPDTIAARNDIIMNEIK